MNNEFLQDLRSRDYSDPSSTPFSIVSTPDTSPVYFFEYPEAETVEMEVIESIQGQPARSKGLLPIKTNILLRLLSCKDDGKQNADGTVTYVFRYGNGHDQIEIGKQDVVHIWGNHGHDKQT